MGWKRGGDHGLLYVSKYKRTMHNKLHFFEKLFGIAYNGIFILIKKKWCRAFNFVPARIVCRPNFVIFLMDFSIPSIFRAFRVSFSFPWQEDDGFIEIIRWGDNDCQNNKKLVAKTDEFDSCVFTSSHLVFGI